MHAVELPAHRTSAGAARRFVGRCARGLGIDRETERDAVLLTSELATNALLHARTPFRVEVAIDGARLRVLVLDRSERTPERLEPDPDEVGGRGLQVVDAVAERWGHEAHPEGKVVWFELLVDRDGGPVTEDPAPA